MEQNEQKPEKVKATTRQQLADLYGIHPETLTRWLKRAQVKLTPRALITPKQQKIIFETLGEP